MVLDNRENQRSVVLLADFEFERIDGDHINIHSLALDLMAVPQKKWLILATLNI
jgi:hypothetical protein